MSRRPSTGSTRSRNPIVWDGPRTRLPHAVAPGEQVELELAITAPRPPGPYRLSFDLVEEHRFWFEEVGCAPLEVEVDVAPRIAERTLAVRIHGGTDPATAAALVAQEEPTVEGDAVAVAHLVAGAVPPPEWSRLLLDGHAEGWGAVGTAVASEGRDRGLGPWRGSGGRNPRFGQPLLLPSCSTARSRRTTSGSPPTTARTDCSTAESPSHFRGDPVVHGAEDSGAENERDHRFHAEIHEVARGGDLPEEQRRPEALDDRRERVAPLEQIEEPRMRLGSRQRLEAVEDRCEGRAATARRPR